MSDQKTAPVGEAAGDHFPHFATLALHVGQEPEQWSSLALVPPITLSSTFKQKVPGKPLMYEYTRGGNPTRSVFEKCVAALEGASHAIATSSGLAAQTAITQLLKSGDNIVGMNDCYGGTHRYFRVVASKFGVVTTFTDATDLSAVEAAIKENTKMVWVESLTNPQLRVVDIQSLINMVKSKNKDILVVVDNTFMTPYFQRPLEMGADIVYHSVTKYINGHSDVLMGVICVKNEDIAEKLRFIQLAVGMVPSPFDCYMANRGLKTLHLRMREHQKNAMAVAHFLQSSPLVTEAIYPGLPSHPQHQLARAQSKGFSGIVSFRIKGGLTEATKFLQALKVFTLAESLGGFDSLAELPSIMTHASIPEEDRAKMGITDSLIRLSVGLEDANDLVDDLEQALKASQV